MNDEKIKLEVDFYADGFRSGVVKVPSELEVYKDNQRRIVVAEELVKHLPKDREWRLSINWWDAKKDNVIVIIRARRINE